MARISAVLIPHRISPATFISKRCTYKTLIKPLCTTVTLAACDHFLSCSIRTQLSAEALNQGRVSGVGRFHTTS